MSSFTLSSDHISTLNLGLSFIPSHSITLPKLDRDFASFSDTLVSRLLLFLEVRFHPFHSKSKEPLFLNTSISNSCQYLSHVKQALHLSKRIFPKPNLLATQRLASKELSTLPNTIIIKPDKGDSIVILDTDQYLSLAYNHLNDETTYKKLYSDVTLEVAQHLQTYLSKLLAAGYIDPITFNF